MADMENALWGADRVDSNETTISHDFVTAMIKGDSGPAPGHWAIKGGDAQAGDLTVYWDGNRADKYARPAVWKSTATRYPRETATRYPRESQLAYRPIF